MRVSRFAAALGVAVAALMGGAGIASAAAPSVASAHSSYHPGDRDRDGYGHDNGRDNRWNDHRGDNHRWNDHRRHGHWWNGHRWNDDRGHRHHGR